MARSGLQEEEGGFFRFHGAVSTRSNIPLTTALLLAFIITSLMFFVSYQAPVSVWSGIIRGTSGFIAIIAIPGVTLSAIFIPQRRLDLGIALLLGILIQILGIQLFYTIALLGGFSTQLIVSVLILSGTVSIFGLLYIHSKNSSNAIKKALYFQKSWRLFGLILVAVALRTILASFADGCLAPDASLYADFARNIQEGSFSTSTLNDVSVTSLTANVDYLAHHAFTYLFAISWLLTEPTISGPIAILIIMGTLIILPVYSGIERLYGKTSALWISGIIAIHPLFVFHSAVGYGPEIASLLFVAYAALLLSGEPGSFSFLATGMLLGLVDVTWYANFFVVCFAVPIVVLYQLRNDGNTAYKSLALLPLAAFARVFFKNPILFYGVWVGIFLLLAFIVWKFPNVIPSRDALLYAGIAFVMIWWRWPVQVHAVFSDPSSTITQTVPLVNAVISPNIFHIIPNFMFFLIMHLSPTIVIFVFLSLLLGSLRSVSIGLVIIGLLTSLGTLMVLSTISGSLNIIYFFSDSRFFLLLTLIFILSTAGYFSFLFRGSECPPSCNRLAKRSGFIVILIIIGLVPSYMLMPAGLTLINMEDRYGWKGLSEIVDTLGDENTVFLANRVREFSWYTGRRCAFLEFSDEGLTNLNASLEMVGLAINFSAQYLLIDGYTIAKWKTLEFLLYSPISVDETIDLNATFIEELAGQPNITIAKLTLVRETEENSYGRMSRVFSLDMLNPI
ncbi:MAG: hypothetical protein ACFFFC_12410, partial [Candidatus Thorarchaeota archaeon]